MVRNEAIVSMNPSILHHILQAIKSGSGGRFRNEAARVGTLTSLEDQVGYSQVRLQLFSCL